MGFDFKGLTSGALVSKNKASSARNAKDVGDVPAAVGAAGHSTLEEGRTDGKLGATRTDSDDLDSDEELNKIDTNAEYGVQRAQAMTQVWTKKDLIVAYIL